MNVLVVSDDEEVCRLLIVNLNRQGHHATSCTSYSEVEALLTKRELSNIVVMTDVCLSASQNGFEVIERLRAEADTIALKGIILMSSYWYENDNVQRILRKWNDVVFLQKPFDVGVLTWFILRAESSYKGEPALT